MRTERLVMRQWRDADREPFAALNADPAVMEHFPNRLNRPESDAFVDRMVDALHRNGYGLWALEVAQTGEFIGFTGLQPATFEAPLDLTDYKDEYREVAAFADFYLEHKRLEELTKQRHDECVGGLQKVFDRNTEGLTLVLSFTTAGNVRSQAVMRRLGMTHDPADDFDHPNLQPGHPMRRHVLYRLRRATAPAA